MRRRWKIISCPTRKRFSPPRRIWRGIEASEKQFDVIHRKIPCWIKDWNCGPGVSRRVQALLEISLPLRSAQLQCAAQPPQSAEWGFYHGGHVLYPSRWRDCKEEFIGFDKEMENGR